MDCLVKKGGVGPNDSEVQLVHISCELFWGDVERRLDLGYIEVTELVFLGFVEDCEGDVKIGGIEVGVEESPAVGEIAVDVLITVEEGVVLDGSNVGEDAASEVAAVVGVSDISLVEEGEGEHVLFLVNWKDCLLDLVIDHVESCHSSDVVGEGHRHGVVVVEQHAWRLIVEVFLHLDAVGLLVCEQAIEELSLVGEEPVKVLVGAHRVVPWSFFALRVEPVEGVSVKGWSAFDTMHVGRNGYATGVDPQGQGAFDVVVDWAEVGAVVVAFVYFLFDHAVNGFAIVPVAVFVTLGPA